MEGLEVREVDPVAPASERHVDSVVPQPFLPEALDLCERVSVGNRDRCLIGMGAILLNGCVIGTGSMAAGSAAPLVRVATCSVAFAVTMYTLPPER